MKNTTAENNEKYTHRKSRTNKLLRILHIDIKEGKLWKGITAILINSIIITILIIIHSIIITTFIIILVIINPHLWEMQASLHWQGWLSSKPSPQRPDYDGRDDDEDVDDDDDDVLIVSSP